MQKVLLIEHDLALQTDLTQMLENEYFLPVIARSVNEVLSNAALSDVHLLLWDVDSPESAMTSIWGAPHPTEISTIVLSAEAVESKIVRWLEAGADDYVIKPFSKRELLARIRSVLRRKAVYEQNVRRFSDITVDLMRRTVSRFANELKLTKVEFNLLACFLQNPDRALTRHFLLSVVWGYFDGLKTRTVDNHIGRLRQKLELDAAKPRHFVTEHGIGYRFLP